MVVLRVCNFPTAFTGSGTTIHQLSFNGRRGASNSPDLSLTLEQLAELKDVAVRAIETRAKEGTLIDEPELPVLIASWREWGESAAANEWFSKTIACDDHLARFLAMLVWYSRSVGSHSEAKTQYRLRRKEIEAWFSFDEPFVERLRRCRELSLSHWPRFAVLEAIKRFDEKEQGIAELDWDELT